MNWAAFPLAALAAVAVFVIAAAAGPSDRKYHCRLVDHSPDTGNFLFRGGHIVKNQTFFDYAALKELLRAEARRSGLELPADFYLVDVCLLNEDDEDVPVERQFFLDNPEKGSFVWYSTLGLETEKVMNACFNAIHPTETRQCLHYQPRNYTEEQVTTLAKTWPSWGNDDFLPSRLAAMRKVLTEVKADKPVVQYFHCQCGCDRTGEVAAAYYMTFRNRTFTQAMAYDITVPERAIGFGNQLMAQWYCEWLVATGRYAHENDCGHCEPFRCYQRQNNTLPYFPPPGAVGR